MYLRNYPFICVVIFFLVSYLSFDKNMKKCIFKGVDHEAVYKCPINMD